MTHEEAVQIATEMMHERERLESGPVLAEGIDRCRVRAEALHLLLVATPSPVLAFCNGCGERVWINAAIVNNQPGVWLEPTCQCGSEISMYPWALSSDSPL